MFGATCFSVICLLEINRRKVKQSRYRQTEGAMFCCTCIIVQQEGPKSQTIQVRVDGLVLCFPALVSYRNGGRMVKQSRSRQREEYLVCSTCLKLRKICSSRENVVSPVFQQLLHNKANAWRKLKQFQPKGGVSYFAALTLQ